MSEFYLKTMQHLRHQQIIHDKKEEIRLKAAAGILSMEEQSQCFLMYYDKEIKNAIINKTEHLGTYTKISLYDTHMARCQIKDQPALQQVLDNVTAPLAPYEGFIMNNVTWTFGLEGSSSYHFDAQWPICRM